MLFNRELFQAQGKESQGGIQWGWGGSTRLKCLWGIPAIPRGPLATAHSPRLSQGQVSHTATPTGMREAPVSTGFGQLSPMLLGKDWLLPEFGDVALEIDKWGSDPEAITV